MDTRRLPSKLCQLQTGPSFSHLLCAVTVNRLKVKNETTRIRVVEKGKKKEVLLGKPGSESFHFKYMKDETNSTLKIQILGTVMTGRETIFCFFKY